jgi:hypothetical protein
VPKTTRRNKAEFPKSGGDPVLGTSYYTIEEA